MQLYTRNMVDCFSRNGSVRARKIKLVTAAKQDAYEGVVCSMKENYGFIERADVVREIFFHYSEFHGEIGEVVPGDDVEFNVQTRNASRNLLLACHL